MSVILICSGKFGEFNLLLSFSAKNNLVNESGYMVSVWKIMNGIPNLLSFPAIAVVCNTNSGTSL